MCSHANNDKFIFVIRYSKTFVLVLLVSEKIMRNYLPFILNVRLLEKCHLENRTESNKAAWKKTTERNYCVDVLRKTKNRYYPILNERQVLKNEKILENSQAITF